MPEIALTPVFARELRAAVSASDAAVLHSALSERERAEAWDRVRAGAARAVIGPRSAAFAPVADPGLFVVDEEHDASYKQRESPRYDAREVGGPAREADRRGARLRFGDARRWRRTTPRRAGRARAPDAVRSGSPRARCRDVDDRGPAARDGPARREGRAALLARRCVERLREVFARGEQAILLQPRRGFAPFLLCRDCGHDFRCTRCSVARTVHDRGRTLLCHYCGERVPRPMRCPECGGTVLEAIGAGTERVAERFAEIFPGVPHAVLDRDTARRRGGAAAVVEDMLRRAASRA